MFELQISLSWWMLPPFAWTLLCLWLIWLDRHSTDPHRGESVGFFALCAGIGNALMLATRYLP